MKFDSRGFPVAQSITSARGSSGRVVGDFVLSSQLGSGSFGKVWLARNLKDGSLVALKEIEKERRGRGGLEKLLVSEAGATRGIDHPNVIKLLAFMETPRNFYLAFEYCEGGDLERLRLSQPECRLPEPAIFFILQQVANGFGALRRSRVLHRDFKLSNVFLAGQRVVIGDFGFAKRGVEVASTRLGTPAYMAPELLEAPDAPYDSATDMWAIGVALFTLATGNLPFWGRTKAEILTSLKKPLELPDRVSPPLQDLIRRMLRFDPAERLSWAEFFGHKAFAAAEPPLTFPRAVQASVQAEFSRPPSHEFKPLSPETQTAPYTAPLTASETEISPSTRFELMKKMAVAEIQGKYDHEKNKSRFMLATASRLAPLAPSLAEPRLLEAAALLAKKSVRLARIFHRALECGFNFFAVQEGFFDLFANSPQKQALESQFGSDLREGETFLAQLLKESKKSVFPEKTRAAIKKPEPESDEIDKLLMTCYEALKKALVSRADRQSLRVLFCLKLCIRSDEAFKPRVDFERPEFLFPWQEFLLEAGSLEEDSLLEKI